MRVFEESAVEAASVSADANLSSATRAQRSLISVLRDAEWLTADRARAWCRVLAAVFLVATVLGLALSRDGFDPLAKPIGTDFVSFWSASSMALDGQAAAVYDPAAHMAAQRTFFPTMQPSFYYAFFYPPPFLLLCLPLAMLPYFAALLVWLTTGFAALFACLRRMLPQRWAILPIVAFPAVLLNASHGQNGFLSAACLGWSTLLLQRRPFVAGMCLGALIYKPHLLLGAPIALLAARRWTAIMGAATSALGTIVLSWLVLGEDAWRGFFQVSSLARTTMEQGLVEFSKMQSAFAAVRLLHGSVGFAYAVQILVAVMACALLGYVAARRPGAPGEGALMVTASLLCTPFLLDYDLVCLALPMAWVMAKAQRTGWLPGEKIVLLAAFALPLISRPIATAGGLPVAPMILATVLLIVARRAWREDVGHTSFATTQADFGLERHGCRACGLLPK